MSASNKELNSALLLGFLIGIIFFTIAAMTFPGSTLKIAVDAVKMCEVSLPRNRICIITAVPEIIE